MKRHIASGYFWSEAHGHRYCVVVLDITRREWKRNQHGERYSDAYAREYHANTIAALRRKAARGGWSLGPCVRANCLASVHYTHCQLRRRARVG